MINTYILVGAAVVVAPVLVRVIFSRRRKLPVEPKHILAQLKDLPCPVSDDSEIWSLERDALFWAEIGGMRGLLCIRRKAGYLRDLVSSFQLAQDDLDEMQFVSHRCYWIMVLVAMQFLLLPFATPHFLGRWAAGLYSEVRTRTLTLCRVYNRELYSDLRSLA